MANLTFATDARQLTVHAVFVGQRINTASLATEPLAAAPLTIGVGNNGLGVIFRYGVIVFIGATADDEKQLIAELDPRIAARFARAEEETAIIRLRGPTEEQISVNGTIDVKEMSLERILTVSDALAKSVVLAHDEREVAMVFDVIEPFAEELAARGSTPRDRKGMLKLIGSALLVQHRVSGRVAVTDKPDALWDRPELERLYARLEDEYELKERFDALNRKLMVVSETATTLADIIDTRRSLRMEIIIVWLITFEIAITFFQIFTGRVVH